MEGLGLVHSSWWGLLDRGRGLDFRCWLNMLPLLLLLLLSSALICGAFNLARYHAKALVCIISFTGSKDFFKI